MQAARLLHPRRRGWSAKLIEMLRAVQLEAHFTKRQILGIWLTLAPFGGNVEGVTAASYAWFGEPPSVLDASQAALLVAIPRRPEALRPDRHPAQAEGLRDRILLAMRATPGPMPRQRVPMPDHAASVVAGLGGGRVVTTLDLPLQAALERLARERLDSLPEHASLAILVADAASRQWRALVSGDGSRGTLDLTRAVRSPGSALKPAVYGMAFQDGIAGPGTLLDDLPRRFGDYAPEDFDRGFAGQVTAAEALRRSLNLPAVALLDQIGPLRFLAALRAAGIGLRLPPGAAPSLPLALGGAGISPRSLAALYAALATNGEVAPVGLLAGVAGAASVALLSPRAAGEVADVLTRPFPQGGPDGVAWKTGTSWGGRDAWAAGFDRRHVAVVWIGRPDGTPLPGATGQGLALPLLSRVLALLPPAPRPAPPLFAPDRTAQPPSVADALRLLFPPPGAVLSGDGPITLRAMGGRRPLTFLVDGAPLPGNRASREVSWEPAATGFFRVTVLDADGEAVHAGVRVR